MRYYLLTLTFFAALPLFAHQYTTYACDTCDYQQATAIAMVKAPAQQCYWNNPPSTIPTPDDIECFAPAATLVVANPVAQQAFKFHVQRACSATSCNNTPTVTDLALTDEDQELLQGFYTLHNTIKDAVHGARTVSLSGATPISIGTVTNATSNSECGSSLLRYLTVPAEKNAIDNQMANEIKQHIGNSTWRSYVSSTVSTGGSRETTISLSPSRTTKIDYSYVSGQLHHILHTGDPHNNKLTFEVQYLGNVDVRGVSEIELTFHINREASVVEGHNLGILTGNDGRHDFSNTPNLPPCILDFISNGPHITVINNGTPGTDPGIGSGVGGGSVDICTTATEASVCSTTRHGTTCTVTTYVFPTLCG